MWSLAAFALSSGTLGAALSSSLSKVRSIAVSYGTVLHPTPTTLFEPAHILSSRIICHLLENWGKDEGGLRDGEVDLYNLNIPLVEGLLDTEGLKICWTRMWRNSYGRLFKAISPPKVTAGLERGASSAGPDSLGFDSTSDETSTEEIGDLVFKFDPDMKDLITPSLSSLPVGSDGRAIHQGCVSVTALRASFAEPSGENAHFAGDGEDKVWKIKL